MNNLFESHKIINKIKPFPQTLVIGVIVANSRRKKTHKLGMNSKIVNNTTYKTHNKLFRMFDHENENEKKKK